MIYDNLEQDEDKKKKKKPVVVGNLEGDTLVETAPTQPTQLKKPEIVGELTEPLTDAPTGRKVSRPSKRLMVPASQMSQPVDPTEGMDKATKDKYYEEIHNQYLGMAKEIREAKATGTYDPKKFGEKESKVSKYREAMRQGMTAPTDSSVESAGQRFVNTYGMEPQEGLIGQHDNVERLKEAGVDSRVAQPEANPDGTIKGFSSTALFDATGFKGLHGGQLREAAHKKYATMLGYNDEEANAITEASKLIDGGDSRLWFDFENQKPVEDAQEFIDEGRYIPYGDKNYLRYEDKEARVAKIGSIARLVKSATGSMEPARIKEAWDKFQTIMAPEDKNVDDYAERMKDPNFGEAEKAALAIVSVVYPLFNTEQTDQGGNASVLARQLLGSDDPSAKVGGQLPPEAVNYAKQLLALKHYENGTKFASSIAELAKKPDMGWMWANPLFAFAIKKFATPEQQKYIAEHVPSTLKWEQAAANMAPMALGPASLPAFMAIVDSQAKDAKPEDYNSAMLTNALLMGTGHVFGALKPVIGGAASFGGQTAAFGGMIGQHYVHNWDMYKNPDGTINYGAMVPDMMVDAAMVGLTTGGLKGAKDDINFRRNPEANKALNMVVTNSETGKSGMFVLNPNTQVLEFRPVSEAEVQKFRDFNKPVDGKPPRQWIEQKIDPAVFDGLIKDGSQGLGDRFKYFAFGIKDDVIRRQEQLIKNKRPDVKSDLGKSVFNADGELEKIKSNVYLGEKVNQMDEDRSYTLLQLIEEYDAPLNRHTNLVQANPAAIKTLDRLISEGVLKEDANGNIARTSLTRLALEKYTNAVENFNTRLDTNREKFGEGKELDVPKTKPKDGEDGPMTITDLNFKYMAEDIAKMGERKKEALSLAVLKGDAVFDRAEGTITGNKYKVPEINREVIARGEAKPVVKTANSEAKVRGEITRKNIKLDDYEFSNVIPSGDTIILRNKKNPEDIHILVRGKDKLYNDSRNAGHLMYKTKAKIAELVNNGEFEVGRLKSNTQPMRTEEVSQFSKTKLSDEQHTTNETNYSSKSGKVKITPEFEVDASDPKWNKSSNPDFHVDKSDPSLVIGNTAFTQIFAKVAKMGNVDGLAEGTGWWRAISEAANHLEDFDLSSKPELKKVLESLSPEEKDSLAKFSQHLDSVESNSTTLVRFSPEEVDYASLKAAIPHEKTHGILIDAMGGTSKLAPEIYEGPLSTPEASVVRQAYGMAEGESDSSLAHEILAYGTSSEHLNRIGIKTPEQVSAYIKTYGDMLRSVAKHLGTDTVKNVIDNADSKILKLVNEYETAKTNTVKDSRSDSAIGYKDSSGTGNGGLGKRSEEEKGLTAGSGFKTVQAERFTPTGRYDSYTNKPAQETRNRIGGKRTFNFFVAKEDGTYAREQAFSLSNLLPFKFEGMFNLLDMAQNAKASVDYQNMGFKDFQKKYEDLGYHGFFSSRADLPDEYRYRMAVFDNDTTRALLNGDKRALAMRAKEHVFVTEDTIDKIANELHANGVDISKVEFIDTSSYGGKSDSVLESIGIKHQDMIKKLTKGLEFQDYDDVSPEKEFAKYLFNNLPDKAEKIMDTLPQKHEGGKWGVFDEYIKLKNKSKDVTGNLEEIKSKGVEEFAKMLGGKPWEQAAKVIKYLPEPSKSEVYKAYGEIYGEDSMVHAYGNVFNKPAEPSAYQKSVVPELFSKEKLEQIENEKKINEQYEANQAAKTKSLLESNKIWTEEEQLAKAKELSMLSDWEADQVLYKLPYSVQPAIRHLLTERPWVKPLDKAKERLFLAPEVSKWVSDKPLITHKGDPIFYHGRSIERYNIRNKYGELGEDAVKRIHKEGFDKLESIGYKFVSTSSDPKVGNRHARGVATDLDETKGVVYPVILKGKLWDYENPAHRKELEEWANEEKKILETAGMPDSFEFENVDFEAPLQVIEGSNYMARTIAKKDGWTLIERDIPENDYYVSKYEVSKDDAPKGNDWSARYNTSSLKSAENFILDYNRNKWKNENHEKYGHVNDGYFNQLLNAEDNYDINEGAFPAIESAAALKFYADKGYDAFTTYEYGAKNYHVIDPKNMRSPFAAFRDLESDELLAMRAAPDKPQEIDREENPVALAMRAKERYKSDPKLQEWFKNASDKMMDKDGLPKLWHHGSKSNEDIKQFKTEGYGTRNEYLEKEPNFFAQNPEYSNVYSEVGGPDNYSFKKGEYMPKSIPTFLNLKKPYETKQPISTFSLYDIFSEATGHHDIFDAQTKFHEMYDGILGYDAGTREPVAVVFDPKKIRSPFAKFENHDSSDLLAMRAKVSESGFFSATEEAVLQADEKGKLPKVANGDDWINKLKGLTYDDNGIQKGLKKSEMEWMGLDTFLEGRNKVTKDEVIDYIKTHNVKVLTKQYGGKAPADSPELVAAKKELAAAQLEWDNFEPEHKARLFDVAVKAREAKEKAAITGTEREAELANDIVYGDFWNSPEGKKHEELFKKLNNAKLIVKEYSARPDMPIWSNLTLDGEKKNDVELALTMTPFLKGAGNVKPFSEPYDLAKVTEKDLPKGVYVEKFTRDDGSRIEYVVRDGGNKDFLGSYYVKKTREEAIKNFFEAQNSRAKHAYQRKYEDSTFESPHSYPDNTLVHIRGNERTLVSGENGFHVDEFQSDLHQTGKRLGYKVPVEEATRNWKVERQPDNYVRITDGEGNQITRYSNGMNPDRTDAQLIKSAYEQKFNTGDVDEDGNYVPDFEGVPDAPFKDTEWIELAFKKALRYAVEQGSDVMTWTTGKQQIDRNESAMRMNVEKIEYQPHPSAGLFVELTVTRTHDQTAQKVIKVPYEGNTTYAGRNVSLDSLLGKKMADEIRANKKGTIEGEGLAIGGALHKFVYDQFLPTYAKKFGKRWGAEPKLVDLNVSPNEQGVDLSKFGNPKYWFTDNQADGFHNVYDENHNFIKAFDYLDDAEKFIIDYRPKIEQVWSLPITPEMRASVELGQPLFMRSAQKAQEAHVNRLVDAPEDRQDRLMRKYYATDPEAQTVEGATGIVKQGFFSNVSAERPDMAPEEITKANNKLRSELEEYGLKVVPAKGIYNGVSDESFLVYYPDKFSSRVVQHFANKYEQESVLHGAGGKYWLEFQDGHRVEVDSSALNIGKAEGVEESPVTASKVSQKNFPETISELTQVKSLGGSTGAKLVTDANGKKYVLKTGNDAGHVTEEDSADRIYRSLGVNVPNSKLYQEGGKTYKLAEFIEGKTLNELSGAELENAQKELKKNFVADALLANYDVIGLDRDNIVIDKQGKVWRIDNGSALRYRAMGASKVFDDSSDALNSLRNPKINKQSAGVFGDLTDAEIRKQANRLLTPETKAAILENTPKEISDTMSARFDNFSKKKNVDGTTVKLADGEITYNLDFEQGREVPAPSDYSLKNVEVKLDARKRVKESTILTPQDIQKAVESGTIEDARGNVLDPNEVVDASGKSVGKTEVDADGREFITVNKKPVYIIDGVGKTDKETFYKVSSKKDAVASTAFFQELVKIGDFQKPDFSDSKADKDAYKIQKAEVLKAHVDALLQKYYEADPDDIGSAWYGERATEFAQRVGRKVEDVNNDVVKLWLWLTTAVTSPNTKVEQNAKYAMNAIASIVRFYESGELYIPKFQMASDGSYIIKDDGTPKKLGLGTPAMEKLDMLSRGYVPANTAEGFSLFDDGGVPVTAKDVLANATDKKTKYILSPTAQAMMSKHGSLQGVLNFLLSPSVEQKKFNKAVDILGDKVGAFFSNLAGQTQIPTIDTWMNRYFMALTGEAVEVTRNKKGVVTKIKDNTANFEPTQGDFFRGIMQKATEDFNAKNGKNLSSADAQAIIWTEVKTMFNSLTKMESDNIDFTDAYDQIAAKAKKEQGSLFYDPEKHDEIPSAPTNPALLKDASNKAPLVAQLTQTDWGANYNARYFIDKDDTGALAMRSKEGKLKKDYDIDTSEPRLQAGEFEAWIDVADRVLQGSTLADSEVSEIKRLSDKKDIEGLSKFVLGLNKQSVAQLLANVWRVNPLVGLKNIGKNTIGNTTHQLATELSRTPAFIFDIGLIYANEKIGGTNTDRSILAPSAISVGKGVVAGIGRGLPEAWSTLKTGSANTTFENSAIFRDRTTGIGILKPLELYTKYGFRLQEAADKPFKASAFYRYLDEQAKLMRKTMPKGATLDDAYNELTIEHYDKAYEASLLMTFQSENKIASEFYKYRERLTPLLQAALDTQVKYVKTPLNVVDRTLDFTGFYPLLKLANKNFGHGDWSDFKAGVKSTLDNPEDRAAISWGIGKGAVGWTMAYIGYSLAMKGMLTAIFDKTDKKERELQGAKGLTYGSMIVGDKSFDISSLTPLSFFMLAGATYADEHKEYLRKLDEAAGDEEKTQKVMQTSPTGSTLWRSLKALALQTPIASQAINIWEKSDQGTKAVAEALIGANAFVPAVVGEVAKTKDGKDRVVETNTVGANTFDTVKAMIPTINAVKNLGQKMEDTGITGVAGLGNLLKGREDLPVKYDMLGREIEIPNGFDPLKTKKVKDDPLLNDLEKFNITINSRDGATAVEQNEEKKNKGQYFEPVLRKVIETPDYQQTDDKTKKKILEDVIRYVTPEYKEDNLKPEEEVFNVALIVKRNAFTQELKTNPEKYSQSRVITDESMLKNAAKAGIKKLDVSEMLKDLSKPTKDGKDGLQEFIRSQFLHNLMVGKDNSQEQANAAYNKFISDPELSVIEWYLNQKEYQERQPRLKARREELIKQGKTEAEINHIMAKDRVEIKKRNQNNKISSLPVVGLSAPSTKRGIIDIGGPLERIKNEINTRIGRYAPTNELESDVPTDYSTKGKNVREASRNTKPTKVDLMFDKLDEIVNDDGNATDSDFEEADKIAEKLKDMYNKGKLDKLQALRYEEMAGNSKQDYLVVDSKFDRAKKWKNQRMSTNIEDRRNQ